MFILTVAEESPQKQKKPFHTSEISAVVSVEYKGMYQCLTGNFGLRHLTTHI